MPPFKRIYFYQNRPKIKLFLQKIQNFQTLGAPPPNSPSIADFWLHAHAELMHYAMPFILRWLTNAIITALVFVLSIAILSVGPLTFV